MELVRASEPFACYMSHINTVQKNSACVYFAEGEHSDLLIFESPQTSISRVSERKIKKKKNPNFGRFLYSSSVKLGKSLFGMGMCRSVCEKFGPPNQHFSGESTEV